MSRVNRGIKTTRGVKFGKGIVGHGRPWGKLYAAGVAALVLVTLAGCAPSFLLP